MSPDDQQVTKRKVVFCFLDTCLISGWKNILPALLRWEKLSWKMMLSLVDILKYTSKYFPNFAVVLVLFLYYNEYHGIWTNCTVLDLCQLGSASWYFLFAISLSSGKKYFFLTTNQRFADNLNMETVIPIFKEVI